MDKKFSVEVQEVKIVSYRTKLRNKIEEIDDDFFLCLWSLVSLYRLGVESKFSSILSKGYVISYLLYFLEKSMKKSLNIFFIFLKFLKKFMKKSLLKML